jgi:hypothetical protein
MTGIADSFAFLTAVSTSFKISFARRGKVFIIEQAGLRYYQSGCFRGFHIFEFQLADVFRIRAAPLTHIKMLPKR